MIETSKSCINGGSGKEIFTSVDGGVGQLVTQLGKLAPDDG